MSTTPDQVLDGVMAMSEEGESTDTRIILSVDEPSRSISYDGNLILGVMGDRFAERIYFKSPQYVYLDGDEKVDLSVDTTKIYINFKNAYGEPYVSEACKKHGFEKDEYVFSWILSEFVTPKSGSVSFNICVKDESGDLKDKDGNVVIREWHTTTIDGTVLPAVNVTNKTPEVITSDTITTAKIIEAMNDYESDVEVYAQNLSDLNESLSDVNGYIDGKVNTVVSDKIQNEVLPAITTKFEDEFDDKFNIYTDIHTIVITYNEQATNLNEKYTSSFDFSTFDIDNPSKYTCVVNANSAGTDTDKVLYIDSCTDNNSSELIHIFASNDRLRLEIKYSTYYGTTTILESKLPAFEAITFKENGISLEEKYVSKNPAVLYTIVTYNNGQLTNNSSNSDDSISYSAYWRDNYTFSDSIDTSLYKSFSNTKYLRIQYHSRRNDICVIPVTQSTCTYQNPESLECRQSLYLTGSTFLAKDAIVFNRINTSDIATDDLNTQVWITRELGYNEEGLDVNIDREITSYGVIIWSKKLTKDELKELFDNVTIDLLEYEYKN